MHITRTRRALAAAASTAVAAAGLAAFAPAANAVAETLDFNCRVTTTAFGPETEVLKDQKFTLSADVKLPASVEQDAAFAVSFSGKVDVSEATRATAAALSTTSVSGTATVSAKLGGVDQTLSADVAKTAVPAAGAVLSLPVAGSGSWKAATLGTQQVTISEFVAPLNLTKADDSSIPAKAFCVASAPETVVGSVEVVKATAPAPKAASKTTAKVKVAKKSKKATATVSVKAGTKAATGKVTLKLKKGKKVVGTKTVTLKKGKAKFTFKKKLKKGSYSLTASYKGNKSTKTSKKVVKFRVR